MSLNAPHRHLQGSTQVTDASLGGLPRQHKGRRATMVAARALLRPDLAVFVPL